MFLWEAAYGTELESERLVLRPSRRSDLAALDDAIRETLDELVRWLPWAHASHSRHDSRQYLRHARAMWARRAAFEFVIEERGSQALLGMVSLHRIDWGRRCGGVGYWVRRANWSKGVAAEAAHALITHAFRACELHRIEAHVATENRASQRVAEKLGFQREGIARQIEFVNGCYLDHVQYSLLRRDFLGVGR